MVPEELMTKAKCVSHSVAFIFSQAGRTRVQVYMGIGLMGRFPCRQLPECQELEGVGTTWLRAILQQMQTLVPREDLSQDL